MDMKKVWFITGCSTGFGRALASHVLSIGQQVVVTARKISDISDLIIGHESDVLALSLDVTKPDEIKNAVHKAIDRFGRIDVLVNNAGIGYFGAVEESEDEAVRKMFEINFFGLANMTKAVLPVMRKQRSGHVINISSVGGLVAFPALGYYNASKFAVDGLSESLAKEVAHLGIHVTIVAPSGFRTDWAGRSAENSKIVIDDYAESAGANKSFIRGYSGNQPGDPKRAAQAIVKAVESKEPPLRLLLGAAALKGATAKLDVLKKDYDAWADTTVWADHPKE
ncbi:short-chain alcohol dehydrogenase/reductase [Cytophaga hutchinsonii ATCC 33406]|uniref:Short-chain alcohol dehydrogenase/reductase n=2 Tax=Cytophaga hutchinsonii TaxID=985 RepID=A0A6N4SVF5_CYTH3|nr:short-chain alcohol dehydrogenase/reductase [Cytophaga hutchinsonii ATCC 33406]SFX89773.1 Short-chain dehydrogenase [Cytophaga hutchinsonii ATCC 33406]